MSGLQCIKKLWLDIHDGEKATPLSKADKRILDQGTYVGVEARKMFPGGLLIEYDRSNLSGSVEKTRDAIKEGAEVLFEAAFTYDDVLVLVDVLKKNKDGSWDLIEVKSTNSIKDQHLPDLAIQKYVLKGNGLTINKSALMHLNPECVYPELGNLFVIDDISEDVNNLLAYIPQNLQNLKNVISQQTEPDVAIGLQCNDPYECSYKEYCWKFADNNAVFDIPNLDKDKKAILRDKGILTLEQLTDEHPLSDANWEYVDRMLNNGIDIDKDGIRAKLNELEYPIHFLDFETYNPAIPRFEGMSPFKQFPFQYSCHVFRKDGQLDHCEYLHDDKSDPRLPLLESLLGCIEGNGSVIAYYATFEKIVLRDLSRWFPNYRVQIELIIDRLWDQLVVFRNHYKHYGFGSTNSLKSVLPVVVPELGYEDLEVQGGSDAQAVWEEMINTDDEHEKQRMIKDLKEYCRMDTLAMVEIHKRLITL